MDATSPIPRLIVGTGPAAAGAAMAFAKRGVPFEVVDVGLDLEPDRRRKIAELALSTPGSWSPEDRAFLFPPPVASASGVDKRLAFGSDFVYRNPGLLTVAAEDCKVDLSHGFGGFGNVWGAAVLPFSASDIESWPVDRPDLERSFGEVLEFVPISGEEDGLAAAFPTFRPGLTSLPRTPQSEYLLAELGRRESRLSRDGIGFGRARVAVNSSGDAESCRRCGHCLDGCVYGSIFNPQSLWKRLEGRTPVHRGFHAVEYREEGGGVVLLCRDLATGGRREFRASRLFLGLGAIASTRLVARSHRVFDRPIRLLDSQYFFFPLLSYRRLSTAPIAFTLAEVFVEVLNRSIAPGYVHFQVYGLNQIFRDTLRAMLPGPARWGPLLRQIEDRFYLFQGFLPSEVSGHLTATLAPPSGGGDEDRLRISGVANPEARAAARRVQALLRRHLWGVGVIPPSLTMVPVGRSFHVGGSFPMGGSDPILSSDSLGRPAGGSRVHLLDPSAFPTIPATTITLTIMANANRVARGSLALAP